MLQNLIIQGYWYPEEISNKSKPESEETTLHKKNLQAKPVLCMSGGEF
jgi:hypothetical protein